MTVSIQIRYHKMNDLFSDKKNITSGPIECMGLKFENDHARREYFSKRLAEKLRDPDFRKLDGFPYGSDDDIVNSSDPPYYTICPNPFFDEFIAYYGRAWSPENMTDTYSRKPFVADVSVAKTDHLYKSHRYHTKVPYKAIAQYLLHFTKPGDIVLDAFCGTGMTGIAAEYVAKPEPEVLRAARANTENKDSIEAGPRYALLADLSPAASMLAYGFNGPIDVRDFLSWAKEVLSRTQEDLGWMFECRHEGASQSCVVTEYVWSEVFSCPECSGEVDFLTDCCDKDSIPLDFFQCPTCNSELKKLNLEKRFENYTDLETGKSEKRPLRRLALVHYKVGRSKYVRKPTPDDLSRIAKSDEITADSTLPTMEIPYMHMTHERARMDNQGVTHYHHLYTTRMRAVLSRLWLEVSKAPSEDFKRLGRFWVDSHFLNLSIQNCYRPGVSFPYNPISGIYYVSSLISEPNPFIAYANKLKQIERGFSGRSERKGSFSIMTGSCTALPISPNSVDYIFTDPPFGENIYYSDLNFLVEAWTGVVTNATSEAIIDRARKKALPDYQKLMQRSFSEYFRVLKPGRWMTVVFSNSKAAVWNAIQVSLQQAGFVVAEVTALDKKQGSYRQVTSTTAVKQDLIISAYKPSDGLEDRLAQRGAAPESAWDFVQTHLRQLPISKSSSGVLETVVERDPRRIYDRMVAWFIRHDFPVPLSTEEFLEGLLNRYSERDGMVFLTEHVAEYDRKRAQAAQAPQRELFVSDERSAIDWLTDFLRKRPSTYQEVHPEFTTQIGAGWKKHEERPELSALLDENFLRYDGNGDVPSQVHSYLSTNFKDLRGLEKEDPRLKAKAKDRWFVPDPNKAKDLEQKRERSLLKEFEAYKTATKRQLKESRLEVLRAGFRTAWATKDYKTIIGIAEKLPDETLQEDEKLLLWYDQALTRTEADA